jgi:hypothetical protein
MSKTTRQQAKEDSLQNAQHVYNGMQNDAIDKQPTDAIASPSKGELIPSFQCVPGQPLSTCPTNLDLTSPRGAAIAFNVSTAADYQLSAEAPTKIKATNYIAFPAEVTNQDTGEINQVTFVALIDKDGKFVKTTSEVVASRVASALSMYTKKHWTDGIPFVLSPKVNPKTKRTYHDIRIDLEEYK